MQRRKVLFPDPDDPMMLMTSPAFACSEYREVNYLILVKNPGGKWIKRDLMG